MKPVNMIVNSTLASAVSLAAVANPSEETETEAPRPEYVPVMQGQQDGMPMMQGQ